MKKILFIALSSAILTSCELIVIGDKTPKRIVSISHNQNSAVGAVYLFKTEIDSNNIPAATQILAKKGGTYINPLDKIEYYDDIQRFGRNIAMKSITDLKTDTLSEKDFDIHVEFDFTKKISFKASLIEDRWFIVNYDDISGPNDVIYKAYQGPVSN